MTTLTTSAKKTAGANDVSGYPSYTPTIATLNATFMEPGDFITYRIDVANTGSMDAIMIVQTNPQTDEDSSFIMSCNAVNGTELVAKTGTTSFECMMKFKEETTTVENIASGTMQVTINAIQKSGYVAPTPQEPETPDFIVDSNGVLLRYMGNGTEVSIPATYTASAPTQEETFYMGTCIPVAVSYYSMSQSDAISMCENFEAGYEAGTLGQGGTPSEEDLKGIGIIDYVYEETGSTVNVVTIGEGAFQMQGLTSVDFSDAIYLTRIGEGAFEDNNLTSLVLPSTLQRIDSRAFNGNEITGTLTIPNAVERIGGSAFASNRIQTLNIGSELRDLRNNAFANNQINGTPTLTTVHIAMTETEWNSVDKGEEIFSPASPSFTYGE